MNKRQAKKHRKIYHQCDCCPYLYRPCYEEDYYECRIWGDAEPPDEYALYNGCKCHEKTLKKIHDAMEKAWLEEAEQFCKWYEEMENAKNDEHM